MSCAHRHTTGGEDQGDPNPASTLISTSLWFPGGLALLCDTFLDIARICHILKSQEDIFACCFLMAASTSLSIGNHGFLPFWKSLAHCFENQSLPNSHFVFFFVWFCCLQKAYIVWLLALPYYVSVSHCLWFAGFSTEQHFPWLNEWGQKDKLRFPFYHSQRHC